MHIPAHVIKEWTKQCECCPECSPHPCDGVMAGGLCDELECECDEEPNLAEDYEIQESINTAEAQA